MQTQSTLGAASAGRPARRAWARAWRAVLGAAALTALASCASTGPSGMGFFVSSTGSGKGADLGGLAGADALCQSLASGVGAGKRTWRAYLSTSATPGASAINARDRIGNGPWTNARGVVVATSVDNLHSSANNLTKQTVLTEKGEGLNGRTDTPNFHDVLTGSQPDGRAFGNATDTTCGNWTQSGAGSAVVGHHDRMGLRDDEPSRSWNSSHGSRGCGVEALRATGGDGRLYCFAAN